MTFNGKSNLRENAKKVLVLHKIIRIFKEFSSIGEEMFILRSISFICIIGPEKSVEG